MFSRVIVAIDFSEISKKQIECVNKLKEAGCTEAVLVSVIEEPTLEESVEVCEFEDEDFNLCIKDVEEKLKKNREKKLEKLAENLHVNYKIDVRFGKPFKEILNSAKENDANLIIMGSHGRGKIEELLVGSVTENVIRHSHIPVLVVK